ncbi:MAG: LysR family transcriptional regulator [Chloroflexota bacterium]|nr:LysR family transcriptional regulator [Chloroflexota bacterium]
MEMRQLEYFVAVAEEANFTRAAAKVHVAQPGVSAQIRQLERELGEELLDRSSRTVRLTKVGAAVLPYARAVLASADGARQAVDELTGLVRGHVAVGMVTACSAVELFDLLAGFRQRHPALAITLTEGNSDGLIGGLLNGELDLAWIGLGGAPPAGLETQVVADEPLVAAVAHNNELAAKTNIALPELGGYPLISLPRGSGLRQALDEASAAARFQPHIAFEASSPAVVAQLAARGLGVAILPESSVGASSELKALTISNPTLRARVELAWRAEGPITPAARVLISEARSMLTR